LTFPLQNIFQNLNFFARAISFSCYFQVANGMLEHKSVIGGEGNGGVMLPDIHIGRDAPVAAALILQQLALSGGKMSELKASLPQWEIVKLKVREPKISRKKKCADFFADTDSFAIIIDTCSWIEC
jgi:phosphomannomutase